ncbi:hypothetical protein E4U53_003077 [Claviceps sorghi]|nr:hypothetical protein E4U53_003077 [Claviceps sorghi]
MEDEVSSDGSSLEADESLDSNVTRHARLRAGGRFVIKDADGDRYLTVEGQDLVLQDCDDVGSFDEYWHWHWVCSEDDGWFRLRNRVTNNYIGVACGGNCAVSIKVKPCSDDGFSGRLVVTPSSGGGQTLSALSRQGGLWQITLGDPLYEAMPRKSGGTSFEFIEMEK